MKKLFALLCIIAILGALCVPAMAATGRVAVAAQVPSDWNTPHLYAWGGSEEMAWPGVPMVMVDDWYVAYMNDDNANVIINNGSDAAKTEDLTITPGLPVCVFALDLTNVEVDIELPIEVPDESAMPKPATDTVYALAPEGWSTAYLYAWSGGGASTNAGWPGVEMTKGDDNLWVGELTPGFENVIITAGNEGPQTVDLPYNGGECWVLLTAEPTADGKHEANLHYEKPDPIKHPTKDEIVPPPQKDLGKDWYVAGTFNGWSEADPAYKMNDDGDGTFSLTFAVDAGNHALKVTNGTWSVSFGGDGESGNFEFGKAVAGDITVHFDGVGTVNVDGIDPPVKGEPGWYVAGSMNEWKENLPEYKMTDNGNGTFSYTFSVTPGDYALKVTDGTWDVCFPAGGEETNYTFNATDEGKVTITFDGENVTHAFGEPETTTTAPTPGPSGNPGTIIAIVATVVILLGGGVAVFFILKKKD